MTFENLFLARLDLGLMLTNFFFGLIITQVQQVIVFGVSLRT